VPRGYLNALRDAPFHWIRTSDLILPNPRRRVLGDHTIPCKKQGILNRNNHSAASPCSGFVSSDHAISDLVVNIWSTRHSKPICCRPRQQSTEQKHLGHAEDSK